MPAATSAVDTVIHLLLYVVGAIALGVAALAVVERSVRSPMGARTTLRTTTVRARHIVVCWGAFLGLFGVERLLHALT